MTLSAHVSDIQLMVPGLESAAFMAPLGGQPSHHLKIGAYRINTIRVDRAMTSERWEILSEHIDAGLRRVDDNQLILCVDYPQSRERIIGKTGEELILVVAIKSLHASGLPQQSTHYIRLDPRGSGTFPSVVLAPPPPHAPLLRVEPLMLELVTHV
jgi:hypothetical protein